MSSINDFNATYMCQGLPFGGVKQSGFGRFAGVEGLRALCVPKVSGSTVLLPSSNGSNVAGCVANMGLCAGVL